MGDDTPRLRQHHRVLRAVGGVLAVLLVVAAIAGGVGFWTVTRSFPQTSGSLDVPDLQKPVTVYRDSAGIPQIVASTADDLFRAQGFVHAQDRFWEMDFRRHVTAGRLSEMFGASQVPTDTFIRTLGWRRVAEQEVKLLDPTALRYYQDYADGVNAYLAAHAGAELSVEYAVLGLQNPGYKPEKWTPVDSIAWLKAMAWDLRSNLVEEVDRALLATKLTPEQIADLHPGYDYAAHPTITSDGGGDPARTTPDAANTTAADAGAAGAGGLHPLAAAARGRLDQHREADPPGGGDQGGVVELGFRDARDGRHAVRLDLPLRGDLVAHDLQRVDARADEDDAGGSTGLGELGVLGEEPVTGMHGTRTGRGGGRDDRIDVEIALAGGRRAQPHGDVGERDMRGVPVGIAVDRDGADAEAAQGADDAAGDLAAVGDEHGGERDGHGGHIRKSPKAVSGSGLREQTSSARPRTVRVSAGSITPSSHSRAVE